MASSVAAVADTSDALAPLASFDLDAAVPTPTGVSEVDRVLGGGLVAGSVTVLGGEPGIGKSTLSLQIAASMASSGAAVMIVTGEEAPSQVAARASRVGPIPPTLSVLDDTSVETIEAAIIRERPQLAIIDSVQTLSVADYDAAPGSVVQVRAAANRLVTAAQRSGTSVILIGHVTKDGALAGPRLLEHVVDTVLAFSGDRHNELRFLRTVKHRFGPTSDVGVFEMSGLGLEPVDDPSSRFLADRRPGIPGSVVVATVDQQRPVLVEVQALVTPFGDRPPRFVGQGLSSSRLELVGAVLRQRAKVDLWGWEILASAAGGAEVKEPGGDLGIALAIASGLAETALGPDVVACGELGLAGEVRSVGQLERRLQEAFRLGFRRAVVPTSAPSGPTGLELIRVDSLNDALLVLGLSVDLPRPSAG